jgi:L-2-hydroxyglutarate oxidase LhgO
MRLGPNDFFVDAIDYEVDESHGEEFFRSACAFLPFLRRDDLSPDTAGIRPKLQGPDEGFRDFIIADERDHGVPGLINLIGIESPGLTASPAIALRVEDLIQTMR